MIIELILMSKGSEVRTIEPDATVAETLHRMRTNASAPSSCPRARRASPVSSRTAGSWTRVDRGVEVLSERVGSVMTREVFTCSRHDRVSAVMALMTNRRIRHVPVVEHDGRLCGIISIGDVVKHRLDEI